MLELKTNLKNVEKVYHLADIHIRNVKRHTEYSIVFENFYKQVKEDAKAEQELIKRFSAVSDMFDSCFVHSTTNANSTSLSLLPTLACTISITSLAQM